MKKVYDLPNTAAQKNMDNKKRCDSGSDRKKNEERPKQALI